MEMWPEGTKAKTGGQAVKSAFRKWQVAGLDPSLGPRGAGWGARLGRPGWILASGTSKKCQAEQPDFILKAENGESY